MRALLRILAVVLLVLLLVPYAVTPLYSVARPVSTLMLWRSMRGERVERIWRPIESLSPALPLAVLIAEDARFCQHAGVDWQGLQAAI
jgi:monofunctional glycosyltransferase